MKRQFCRWRMKTRSIYCILETIQYKLLFDCWYRFVNKELAVFEICCWIYFFCYRSSYRLVSLLFVGNINFLSAKYPTSHRIVDVWLDSGVRMWWLLRKWPWSRFACSWLPDIARFFIMYRVVSLRILCRINLIFVRIYHICHIAEHSFPVDVVQAKLQSILHIGLGEVWFDCIGVCTNITVHNSHM